MESVVEKPTRIRSLEKSGDSPQFNPLNQFHSYPSSLGSFALAAVLVTPRLIIKKNHWSPDQEPLNKCINKF